MKVLILALLILFSFNSPAKDYVKPNCSEFNLYQLDIESISVFESKTLIEIGHCLGLYLLENQRPQHLVDACKEFIEHHNNSKYALVFLSKAEAIKIGQCLGVIDYAFEQNLKRLAHDKRLNYRNRYNYQPKRCIKNTLEAAKTIASTKLVSFSIKEITKKICH